LNIRFETTAPRSLGKPGTLKEFVERRLENTEAQISKRLETAKSMATEMSGLKRRLAEHERAFREEVARLTEEVANYMLEARFLEDLEADELTRENGRGLNQSA
jgi:uncharacterized protein involved in exopolysaccharide biosynthesis